MVLLLTHRMSQVNRALAMVDLLCTYYDVVKIGCKCRVKVSDRFKRTDQGNSPAGCSPLVGARFTSWPPGIPFRYSPLTFTRNIFDV